jgi:hypothetical protein
MSANGVISAISTLRLLLLVFPRVDGSAKAPAGWEFSSEASSRTLELGGYPLVLPVDVPNTPNLTLNTRRPRATPTLSEKIRTSGPGQIWI